MPRGIYICLKKSTGKKRNPITTTPIEQDMKISECKIIEEEKEINATNVRVN